MGKRPSLLLLIVCQYLNVKFGDLICKTELPLPLSICPFPWWFDPPWWLDPPWWFDPPWWVDPWWLPWWLPQWLPGPPLVRTDVVDVVPPPVLPGAFLHTEFRQQQTMAAVQKMMTMRPPTIIPTDAATPRDRNWLNTLLSEMKNQKHEKYYY